MVGRMAEEEAESTTKGPTVANLAKATSVVCMVVLSNRDMAVVSCTVSKVDMGSMASRVMASLDYLDTEVACTVSRDTVNRDMGRTVVAEAMVKRVMANPEYTDNPAMAVVCTVNLDTEAACMVKGAMEVARAYMAVVRTVLASSRFMAVLMVSLDMAAELMVKADMAAELMVKADMAAEVTVKAMEQAELDAMVAECTARKERYTRNKWEQHTLKWLTD